MRSTATVTNTQPSLLPAAPSAASMPTLARSAGQRPAAGPGARSSGQNLAALLTALPDLDLDGLRLQWRNHLGGSAPSHLPRWLLLKILAYRIQAQAFGDLDKATLRVIRTDVGEGAAFVRRTASTRDGLDLKPGALLTREWKGRLERVMVLDEGFAWNGATYRSLSQVAKAITGTSWNGHRFFGLRARAGDPPSRRMPACKATRQKAGLGEGERGSDRRRPESVRERGAETDSSSEACP